MPPRPIAAPLALLVVACGTSTVQPGRDGEALESPAESTPPDAELGGRPYELIEGEPMVTVLPQGAIQALDAPSFVSAQEALDFMQPEETVLGVVGRDGTAKCYSAWQLDGHEIVNDDLDGEPIAASW